MSLYEITNNFGNRNVNLYVNDIFCNNLTPLSIDCVNGEIDFLTNTIITTGLVNTLSIQNASGDIRVQSGLNASGSSITCDYLSTNNTVYIGASGVSDTGTGLQVAHGGIDLSYGSINNNYCCQLTKFATQLINSGVYTKITGLASSNTYGFNNQLGTMADNPNSQIVIQKTGLYHIRAQCYNELAVTSGVTLVFGVNGSYDDFVFGQSQQILPSDCTVIETYRRFTAGNTIQMFVGVPSSGNLGGVAAYQGFYLYAGLID